MLCVCAPPRACHLKLLSQLSTIVQVSGIDAALAAKCVLNVTFREAIPHANALVFFEPAPYEERCDVMMGGIVTLTVTLWSNGLRFHYLGGCS